MPIMSDVVKLNQTLYVQINVTAKQIGAKRTAPLICTVPMLDNVVVRVEALVHPLTHSRCLGLARTVYIHRV